MTFATAISTARLISSFNAAIRASKVSSSSILAVTLSTHFRSLTLASKAQGFVFPWTRISEQPSLV